MRERTLSGSPRRRVGVLSPLGQLSLLALSAIIVGSVLAFVV
jgi:hypothetical protein